MTDYRLMSYGDDALLVEFEEELGGALPMYVAQLRETKLFSDVIPAYRSITVQFDPQSASEEQVREVITKALSNPIKLPPGPLIEVPVYYNGPDLRSAAKTLGLKPKALIEAHSAPVYDVAFLGFLPGFTFLSGLPKTLALPRLETPRLRVKPGSVGIAKAQTGIYSLPSPGGWQLLGRTPWRLFNPEATQPFRFKAADRLKFTPISKGEFDALLEHEA